MSSPTHDFDNFSCKMSSPGKNFIIYDVLTTNIHRILAKNFKKISQNLKKLKVYLQLLIYSHIFALCAWLICTEANPWDIFCMNWHVWHWLYMIQRLLELDVSFTVWIFSFIWLNMVNLCSNCKKSNLINVFLRLCKLIDNTLPKKGMNDMINIFRRPVVDSTFCVFVFFFVSLLLVFPVFFVVLPAFQLFCRTWASEGPLRFHLILGLLRAP